MFVTFLIFYCLISCTHAVVYRAAISNGTSAVFDNITTSLPIYNSADVLVFNTTVPTTYAFNSSGSVYPYYVAGYIANSFNSMKLPVSPASGFNSLVCGSIDRIRSGANSYSVFACLTYNDTCGQFVGNGVIMDTISNISKTVYAAVPPRALLSSQSADGSISFPGSGATNAEIWAARIDIGINQRFVQFRLYADPVPFVTYDTVSSALPLGTFLIYQPYHDYSVSGTKTVFTYFAVSATTFYAYTSACSGSGCGAPSSRSVTGYNLINHYSYSEGAPAPVPIFVLTNVTHILLATLNKPGDLSLVHGVTVLTAAPIVGCQPDAGTIINWNNTANPYNGTVHLYTLCNDNISNGTVPNSGAVYEINTTASTMTFNRWRTVGFNSSIAIQIIGEYGHILSVTDTARIPPLSMNVGLYHLYDPFVPTYIGYATLSQAANLANTVNSNFYFTFAADVARYSCGRASAGHYLTSQFYTGVNQATIQFCGSGNPQYNNLSYCDGSGVCCGDYCAYRPSNYSCNSGNLTACAAPSNCSGSSVTCAAPVYSNGTWCGAAAGICYQNATCYGGICTPNLPLSNATVIQPALACQSAYYCNGTGNLINGSYYSNLTICSPANVSACRGPSYCTGSTSSCPANPILPDGTICSLPTNVCYSNSTCQAGICTVNPLPNNTIITNATVCQTAYICNGAGQLINGTFNSNTTLCRAGNISACTANAFCTGASSACPVNPFLPDNTTCAAAGGICYSNSTCQAGVCTTNPLPNNTIITNATVCQTAYICNGAGQLINGTFNSNTTLCRAGNISVCAADAFCTGASSACPANPILPNNTICAAAGGICYSNSTCQAGVCTANPLPNNTIITNATVCQTAYICNGAGQLINGTFNSNVTLCRAGNISACIADAFCTGASSACPANGDEPDGTICKNITGNACASAKICAGGSCNATSGVTNGTACPRAYPCSAYAACYGYQCIDFGLLPFGTPCNSSAPVVPSICLTNDEVCNGVDAACHNITTTDCFVFYTPGCNISGKCIDGNCVTDDHCTNIYWRTLRALGENFSAPAYVIAVCAVALAFLGIFVFLHLIIVGFY